MEHNSAQSSTNAPAAEIPQRIDSSQATRAACISDLLSLFRHNTSELQAARAMHSSELQAAGVTGDSDSVDSVDEANQCSNGVLHRKRVLLHLSVVVKRSSHLMNNGRNTMPIIVHITSE